MIHLNKNDRDVGVQVDESGTNTPTDRASRTILDVANDIRSDGTRTFAQDIVEQSRELSRVEMKSGKAPGPDGIPVEVLKAIAYRSPETLLNVYNVCLREGVFSSRWK